MVQLPSSAGDAEAAGTAVAPLARPYSARPGAGVLASVRRQMATATTSTTMTATVAATIRRIATPAQVSAFGHMPSATQLHTSFVEATSSNDGIAAAGCTKMSGMVAEEGLEPPTRGL